MAHFKHLPLIFFATVVITEAAPGIIRVRLEEKQIRVEARFPRGTEAALLLRQAHQPEGQGFLLKCEWNWVNGATVTLIPRFDSQRDNAFCLFQLLDKATGNLLGQGRWINNIESASRRKSSFPAAQGIKGLQCIEDIDDALRLGIKQAALNVTLDQLVDWKGNSRQFSWQVDGGIVCFHADYVDHIDSQLKRLTDAGVVNSLIIYNRIPRSRDRNPLIHPRTDMVQSPFRVGAFNLATADGVRVFRAAIEFLAERYSKTQSAHGLAQRFIIGNEIQSHWHWYNLGEMPPRQVVEEYHKALRLAHLAAHGIHPEIQLYISLDHHWSTQMGKNPLRGMPGKYFIETLNRLVTAAGNFEWHVAFHPYPENLFNPKTWEDTTATDSFETKKITFKNIQILPEFLRQARFLYKGKPRRVILSEQGFHSANGVNGEREQAAAYAYAYTRVRHINGIDAFILHRHIDHPGEGGLRLGLRSQRNGGQRIIYEVFRHADTPGWPEAFQFALPIIGIKNWAETLSSKRSPEGQPRTRN